MKKFLLFMLGVLLALPGIARDFTYEYEGQTLTYTIIDEESKTCKTKDGSYYVAGNYVYGALVIPSVAKDGDSEYTVTLIGFCGFDHCKSLTSVIIPNSVTSIAERAFEYCDNLTSVTIPNSVTSIAESAFEYCDNLTSVIIPNSVTSIGKWAFASCSGLTSVIIGNSVTSIGDYAFGSCSGLKKSAYPSGLYERPFSDGKAIEYPREGAIIEDGFVYGPEKNAIYFAPLSLDGEYIIPNSVTSIAERAFEYCDNLTSVIIGNSVTSIGDYAFSGCSGLKKSAYPSGLFNPFYLVRAIRYPREGAIIEDGFVYGPEKSAIYFAPLSLDGEYIIPNSVTSIGENAFYGCSGLTSVKATAVNPPVMNDNSFEGLYDSAALSVPEEATADYLATPWSLFKNLRIGDSEAACHIYETGNLKYMLIPGKTQEDKNLAVVMQGDYSSLTEITIPERFTVSDNGTSARYYVDAIGYKAFSGCSNLATVTFNSRNASRLIGDYAFAGTKISALTIPETVEAIGNYAFNQCSDIGSISVPGSVESIGDYAFNECYSLTDVTLQEGVKTIGDYAFYGSPLKQMNLNEGLVSIGEYAFSAGYNRKAGPIYMPSTLESVGKNAFENFRCEKVNISDLSAWLRINFRQADGNPLHNSYVLWLNGEELTELTIPEDIIKVNQFAFYGCSSLNSVTFGENVESIAESAFSGCSDISKVTFNDALQTMGDFVFYNCASIKSVVLPASLTTLGKGAFSGCTSLRNLTVGASLVQCNDDSFKDCNFKNLTIADGLNKLKLGGTWDKIEIINLYMGRPIEFVSSEK